MDKELEGNIFLIFGALMVLIIIMALTVAMLLPTWYAITGDWANYIVWIPIVYYIARVFLGPASIILGIIMMVWKRNIDLGLGIIYQAIMIWFGYPALQNLWITLATIPLSGIDLQRAIIQVLAFIGFGVMATYSTISHTHKEYVKKEK